MTITVLTGSDVDELLHLVVRGTRKAAASDDDWLIGSGKFAFRADNTADADMFIRHPSGHVMQISWAARRALEVTAQRLREQLGLPEPADEETLQVEIIAVVGDVIAGSRKMKGLGNHCLEDLAKRMARSVTVFAVAGLDLRGTDTTTFPLNLGDRVVLGPLTDATEKAISSFTQDFVGQPLRFSEDAWWAEDWASFKVDPEAFEDGSPSDHLAVIAVGLDSLGDGAAIRAREHIEALLGALWLMDQSSETWPSVPPWILGGPNRAESPRDHAVHDGRGLPMVGLQVNTRASKTSAVSVDLQLPEVGVATVLEDDIGLVELITKAEAPVSGQAVARRVAAACRLAWVSGQDASFDLRTLHLVIALEALVSDHAEGGGVTSRFIARLLALQDPAKRNPAKLSALYDRRSEIGHQGYSTAPRSHLANATAYGHSTLTDCVLGAVEAVKQQGLREDRQFLAWLDRSSPDTSDPFG